MNRYAFANCNPVANIDPLGLSAERGAGSGYYITKPDLNTVYYYNDPIPKTGIPKWLLGSLTTVGGGLEMLSGAALGAALGWTGWGAFLAGLLVVDGAGRVTQGTAQIVNDIAGSNIMYEGNIPRDCTVDVGRIVAGDSGATVAGMAYDSALALANCYLLWESLPRSIRYKLTAPKSDITPAKQTDFYTTPDGVTFHADKLMFEQDLSKMDVVNGKYVGSDNYGPIRIRYNEIHEPTSLFTGTKSPYHEIPHFHFDRKLNVTSGKWREVYTGAMEMLK